MARSIFDLNIDELATVVETGDLPEGISYAGIENRNDFKRLFRHRGTPSHIAQILLKEKATTQPKNPGGGSQESEELKQERLRLKQLELAHRQNRVEKLTAMQVRIDKKLQDVEDLCMLNMKLLQSINETMTKLTERYPLLSAE